MNKRRLELSSKEYVGLGRVPIGIGAVLKGWDLTEEEYRNHGRLPVVDFRAMTGSCLHECFHCFTDKEKKTLTLSEIKYVIDQLAEHKTHAIDYLGEGEPTLDRDFFEIIEYTSKKGIIPVIFTDVATKMRNPDFVKRVFDSGASVIPKCDSLFNEEYQNWVVQDKSGEYFRQRNEGIELLIKQGFNEVVDGTTRIGFDVVVSKKNIDEAEKTLRYCRENNLWIVFTFYLPAGRSGSETFDSSLNVTEQEKTKMREIISKTDAEYGFVHPTWNNFATNPCVEFMQIYGDGRVSSCPGNESVVGNIKETSVIELEQKILKIFPDHNRSAFSGHCLYREKID
ncbi:MAG: radical SAM protein [Candidatus Nanoarchaeia archaeon]